MIVCGLQVVHELDGFPFLSQDELGNVGRAMEKGNKHSLVIGAKKQTSSTIDSSVIESDLRRCCCLIQPCLFCLLFADYLDLSTWTFISSTPLKGRHRLLLDKLKYSLSLSLSFSLQLDQLPNVIHINVYSLLKPRKMPKLASLEEEAKSDVPSK